MEETKNGGIVVWWRDARVLLAIPGFGSPKIEVTISSAILGLGCSGRGGGGVAKEGSCCPKSPSKWEWNPMWDVPGSKHLKWIKAFIACIALLKKCRGATLSFFRAQRRRSLVRIESFLDLLHIFLELLVGFPLLMKPSLNSMVRATHAK
jgi:hypothetical protein